MSPTGHDPAAMDDLAPLERELRDALRVEPSADFLPRLRERLVCEEATGRSWWFWLAPAAATLAIAAALLLAQRWLWHAPAPGADTHTTMAASPAAPPGPAPGRSVSGRAAPSASGSSRRLAVAVPTARRRARPDTNVDAQRPLPILAPPGGELALQRFVDSIRGHTLGAERNLSASADTLAPDPREHAAAWPTPESHARQIDEVGWQQLEPVVMDD